MAEWVSHALLAYAVFTVLGWYVEWIDKNWVAVAMVGSILPDMNRLGLLISEDVISYVIGFGFDWNFLHTLGGIFLTSSVGALLFSRAVQRRRALFVLFGGAFSHILIDLPQKYADGRMLTDYYFYPFPVGRLPTPGWYVSSDRWVLMVSLSVGLTVFLIDRAKTEQNG